ncbi:MAG TPA: glycoside hydrolase family 3 protein [Candidatus Paceibacterota bacterium]|nr:glycoside hydrolase family 3 protein [Candidatus Paceibacterota bacterium]
MKTPRFFPGIASLMAIFPLLANGSPESDADALLGKMTLAEKIGQMVQVDTDALRDKSHIQKYFLGSVLSGGGSDPAENSPQGWLKLANECRFWALETRLKIPLLYGVDAVHGHNNVIGAVIFPHNIGLGATHNPALVEKAARITAEELAGTGINWAFAPCVAVAQDARWGRTYESFSDSPDIAGILGAATVKGFQGNNFKEIGSVLACAKHFLGDGGTQNGIDQGNTVVDEATLRKIHLAPYLPSINGGVGSVMASFSSWNGTKMHENKHLLTGVLKGELGFKGFVVSDWAAIDQLPHDYKGSIEASVNAGLDMAMIPNGPGQPNNYVDFIAKLTELVQEGRVPMARIDDAVRRILRAKFEAGVFERKTVDPALTAAVGSGAHRQVARECVRQSLVLLKNNQNALPLSKSLKRLCVVGQAADDLGMQCGGWTISWQGDTGRITTGTTILEAIRQTVNPGTVVSYSADGAQVGAADAVLVVLGEKPYAEIKGYRSDLRLSAGEIALVKKARQSGAPVITMLVSGRPLVLGEALDASDAVVAAWLPGTEGQGVADVLFGDFKPTGKLPRTWLDANVPADAKSAAEVAYAFGYGLTYGSGSVGNPGELKAASASK